MNASELFKQGALQEAIQAQINEVKAAPGDHAKRTFLFELLTFAGDLDRARKQIEIIKYDEMERDAAVANYRRLLDAEGARRKLFEGGGAPRFFTDSVPRHVELRLQAIQALRDKRSDEATRVLNEAQSATPPHKGTLNGKPFTEFRDCDDLFAGVLEVMAQGQYFWVPFEQVETLALNPPRFPRDLIWLPARLEMRHRGMGEIFLPVRYPGAEKDTNVQVQLGRVTEFAEGEPVLGRGSRLFLVGDDAVPLAEFRELFFDEPEGQSASQPEPPATEGA